MIPRENIKAGDRVKAYCLDVSKNKEVNRSFYHVYIINLWKTLFKKFQKFMMD